MVLLAGIYYPEGYMMCSGNWCVTAVLLLRNRPIHRRIYMRLTGVHAMGLLLFLAAGLLDSVEARPNTSDDDKVDPDIRHLIGAVDFEQMSRNLFYLSKDPLPYRKLNLTLPGHQKNTLYEADDYLASRLESWGYRVEREAVRVQAFRRDTSKPKHAQYSAPKPEDPWYTAYNLYAERKGSSHPDRIILVLAHKDSQSWIDSPGANDNAIGTAAMRNIRRGRARRRRRRRDRVVTISLPFSTWTVSEPRRQRKPPQERRPT
jgi:hypothetical protein